MSVASEVVFNGKIYIPRWVFQIIAYIIVPLFLAAYTIYHFINETVYLGFPILGSIGFYLLLFLLYIKPLSIIFPELRIFSTLVTLRRQFGISFFYFGFFHGFGYYLSASFTPSQFFASMSIGDGVLYGFLAMIIFTLMYLTSNNLSVRTLGPRKWKFLHRFVYLALFLIFIHVSYQTGDWRLAAVTGITYAILKTLEFLKFQIYLRKKKEAMGAQG